MMHRDQAILAMSWPPIFSKPPTVHQQREYNRGGEQCATQKMIYVEQSAAGNKGERCRKGERLPAAQPTDGGGEAAGSGLGKTEVCMSFLCRWNRLFCSQEEKTCRPDRLSGSMCTRRPSR